MILWFTIVFVGLGLLVMVMIWGRRLRDSVRRRPTASTVPDPFWYLKKNPRRWPTRISQTDWRIPNPDRMTRDGRRREAFSPCALEPDEVVTRLCQSLRETAAGGRWPSACLRRRKSCRSHAVRCQRFAKGGRRRGALRVKRLLREAFRLSQHDLPSGLDLVLIPQRGVGQLSSVGRLSEFTPRVDAASFAATQRRQNLSRKNLTYFPFHDIRSIANRSPLGCRRTGIRAGDARTALSMAAQSALGRALPLLSVLQRVLHRRGPQVRGNLRLSSRHLENLPLPSFSSGWLRSPLIYWPAEPSGAARSGTIHAG